MARKTKPKRGRRPPPPNSENSPIIWGAEAIGAYIGRSASQIYAMARAGKLPVRHVGALLVARRDQLDRPELWPNGEAKD